MAGAAASKYNLTKMGVSISNTKHLSISGHMNQEATVANLPTPKVRRASERVRRAILCADDATLTNSLTALSDGDAAPTRLSTKNK